MATNFIPWFGGRRKLHTIIGEVDRGTLRFLSPFLGGVIHISLMLLLQDMHFLTLDLATRVLRLSPYYC